MSKDSPRLSRLGVLAPAALSACMDASVLAVPAAGAIVSTVLKELSKAFMLKKWFHGVMSAKEAEQLIMDKGKNGSFLVRESQAHPGEYVLSVRVRGRVSHVMIKKQHEKYDVGSGELFDDLVGLIEHLRSFPMADAAGDELRLLQPVSGHRLRAHAARRPLHAQITDRLSNDYNDSFDGEFLSLRALEERQVFTTLEGEKIENKHKNRYRNILPYDQTRVILRGRAKDDDYINANYVRPYRQWESSSSVQSSNESLNSVKSLFVSSDTEKSSPLVSKSLSDDALREVNKWFKLDRINGNLPGVDTVHDKTYIATQGCLSNTKNDFWRMVWQEDVRVIAMVANEIEKGKRKCARYWPGLGHETCAAGLRLFTRTETLHDEYVEREIVLSDDSGLSRTIYHFQFTAWPDQGAPKEAEGLLAFRAEISRRMALVARSPDPPYQNILCVHCSAGVGRTGTFIVIDMLLDTLKYGGFAGAGDVARAVSHARCARVGLVQNKAQYRFIYRTLQAFLHKKNSKKVYTLDA